MSVQEARARWVEALRSGDYEQGRNRLRDMENRFCCLGVACDINGIEWFPDVRGGEDPVRYGIRQMNGAGEDLINLNCSGLPPVLERDLGVASGTFIELNDDLQCSFSQIADYIEALPV